MMSAWRAHRADPRHEVAAGWRLLGLVAQRDYQPPVYRIDAHMPSRPALTSFRCGQGMVADAAGRGYTPRDWIWHMSSAA